ncbi:cyclic lactone autoinducer peptide [Clostridium sp. MSJ-4]|uniref:Cyclic lactone autoinducer peptide n=1 Tax=Clostridium simiarum TaxID=2841506 RepID=A0ABS6EYB5_9CLOT|nr:cyclic lactone autoinducer peptide [Clostridium simiarum]MBU5591224.1 cyclic lactone autoinducer peptide [Clostridium simiarum]
MKKKKNALVHMLGLSLVAISQIISSSASFFLAGEPEPPKSLLK